MLYYDTDRKSGRNTGLAAAAMYVGIWFALMLLVSFTFEQRDTGEGILIDFGDSDTGSGTTDPDLGDPVDDVTAGQTVPVTDPDHMLTQDWEDAPEVPASEAAVTTPATQPQRDSRAASDNAPAERTVDSRALFPGRTQGSTSTSQGDTTGAGNQGTTEGSPGGSNDGGGAGAGGTGFDLAGRSVVGSLPQPTYGSNKSGRVLVSIVVDSRGVVQNATYRANGSTTNDSELVNAALRAARQSRFNVIDSDQLQTGTITYNFTLR